MTTKKYRPYFTIPEIEEIVTCLKHSPSPRRLQIAKYLESFIFQIRLGVRKENHTLAPTLIERLELETPVPAPHEVSGEAAYQKWVISPKDCTAHEISVAMEWAYLNDKLTPQQEVEFEKERGF